jgi:AcrR family transcriptional regulator
MGDVQTEATDARILDLAAEHIRRHGIERTTVVAIAREAGMSHANVYRYFPSKEALVDSVTAHWLRPVETGLHDIADAPDPADDKLERLLVAVHRAYRRKLETDPNLFRLFTAAIGENRGVARKHRNRLQTEIGRILEEGMAGGAFQPADARRSLALVFDGAHRFIHPVCVAMDAEVPRPQIENRFERVVRLILRALATGVR